QRGLLGIRSLTYLGLNLAGSLILAVIALLHQSWGFLLLEGTWAIVSGASALGVLSQRRAAGGPRSRAPLDGADRPGWTNPGGPRAAGRPTPAGRPRPAGPARQRRRLRPRRRMGEPTTVHRTSRYPRNRGPYAEVRWSGGPGRLGLG